MRTLSDSTLIINKIKEHYKFKSNVELATFLGITTGTLSGWAGNRGIGNWELLFEKCNDIDLNWLIFNERSTVEYANREHDGDKHVLKEQKTIYCSQCPEKDIEIARLKKEIDTFVRILDMLDDKKQSHKAS